MRGFRRPGLVPVQGQVHDRRHAPDQGGAALHPSRKRRAPACTGEIIDPSGEGYQAATGNPLKERVPATIARQTAEELTRGTAKAANNEAGLTLDPRPTAGGTVSGPNATMGADASAGTSTVDARNRNDDAETSAREKHSLTAARESSPPSLVVLEQQQLFGTGVDPHHHSDKERAQRRAEQVEIDGATPPSIDQDRSWGIDE